MLVLPEIKVKVGLGEISLQQAGASRRGLPHCRRNYRVCCGLFCFWRGLLLNMESRRTWSMLRMLSGNENNGRKGNDHDEEINFQRTYALCPTVGIQVVFI
jgi:hypothetical protein